MRSRGRYVARIVVPLAGLFLTAPLPQKSAPAAQPEVHGDQISSFRHEVRLRKLHLVRPDLIPYPIAYEIYC